MSNNKVGVLNTKISLEDFIKENPLYNFSPDKTIISNNNGSWAFIAKDDVNDNIQLVSERHVSKNLILDLLAKYGGEYYESEYDNSPTKVFVSENNMKEISNKAEGKLKSHIHAAVERLNKQIKITTSYKEQTEANKASFSSRDER